MDNRPLENARALIFGEVLFDVFPEAAVIGGAPFNVAWHLHGFGLQPLFVSRVGEDAAGERVLETMRAWGMDEAGVQIDSRYPTGEVRVELGGGGHTFEILPDRAYDHIDADAACRVVAGQGIGLIYHGTLALRGESSRDALRALQESVSAPRCVDINLRAPWWQPSLVQAVIDGAAWVKLNEDELAIVGSEAAAGEDDIATRARALRGHHRIDTLIVTCGAEGALFVDNGGLVRAAAAAAGEVVDTVGAGDAFAAVALLGMMRGWDTSTTLHRALAFAAWICTVRGAVVDDPGRYRRFLDDWDSRRV